MQTTEELVRSVKQSLRSTMNGVAARSMRDKGLAYKVIFGTELPRLQEMAQLLPHSANLSHALWQEDIRECRLLAPMLMPPEEFAADEADAWVSAMRFPEEADVATFHLFCRLPYAADKAFAWMAAESTLTRYCGYQLLGRLLAMGSRLTTRDAHQLLDHAAADRLDASLLLRRAAYRTLLRFADCGMPQARMAEQLLADFENAGAS